MVWFCTTPRSKTYCLSSTALSSLSCLIFTSYEEDIIVPILHMRKLRHREVKQPVQNYIANKGRVWGCWVFDLKF